MTVTTSKKTRKAPPRAFDFAANFEFAEGDETEVPEGESPVAEVPEGDQPADIDPVAGDRDAEGVLKRAIKLTASSGVPFDHWYWGRVVFDFAGMVTTAERVTLDYCHEDVIGFATVEKLADSLVVSGELVSVEPNDRAHEVMRKGPAGVPYEASVKFDPWNGLVVEEFQAGTTASVNGQTYEGPITVLRQSLLRGVAVCPYGADPYTSSEFAADKGKEAEFSITVHKPDDKAPAQPQDKPADARAELRAQLADYSARFGGELGAKWLSEDKPVIDCYAEFVAKMATEHAAELAAVEGKATAAEAKVAELQTRIEQLGEMAAGGEKAPLSSRPAADGGDKQEQRVAEFADKGATAGVARFAAGMRLNRTKTKNTD